MTEERSRASHHVEDLIVLSRRGALSPAQQRALADALDASPALAAAYQLRLDFDQVAAVKPGDDALIAAAAARSVSRSRSSHLVRFRVRTLLLAAALVLTGSASAAAFWQRSSASAAAFWQRAAEAVGIPTTPQPSARPSTRTARAAAARVLVPMAEPDAAAAKRPPPAPAPLLSTPTNLGHAPNPRLGEPVAPNFDSSESLFREANTARRAGDQALARSLYLRLERDFPASDAARLTHVSLGNLLLAMGRPSEAEQQFSSYLGGRSALAQEARVGRAQCLAMLGRSAEEQRVWESLLLDYPSSVYAGRAKQRLAVLTHAVARPQ